MELASRTVSPVCTRGREVGAEPDRSRFGLQGMRERADVVGGRLEAGPDGAGWRVRCMVPVRASG